MILDPNQRSCIFWLLLIGGLTLSLWKGETQLRRYVMRGQTMGSIMYQIQYVTDASDTQLPTQSQVDSLLECLDKSFSTYRADAEIVHFNTEGVLRFSSVHWPRVLALSQEVYEASEGAFDPTLGPIIEAWGFGPSGVASSDTARIEELLNFVGFDRLDISKEVLKKTDPRQRIDLSAVAKGYAVDLLAETFEGSGIRDYMIEIGGEVRVSGHRKKHQYWRVGIQDPLATETRPAAIVALPHGGLATSGNYRNFRQVGDHRYGHTINPRTGRPEHSLLLSATIWAPNTAQADALATACLVLGLSKGRALIRRSPEVEALFLYKDSLGNLRSYLSDGIRPYVSALRYDTLSSLL